MGTHSCRASREMRLVVPRCRQSRPQSDRRRPTRHGAAEAGMHVVVAQIAIFDARSPSCSARRRRHRHRDGNRDLRADPRSFCACSVMKSRHASAARILSFSDRARASRGPLHHGAKSGKRPAGWSSASAATSLTRGTAWQAILPLCRHGCRWLSARYEPDQSLSSNIYVSTPARVRPPCHTRCSMARSRAARHFRAT